MFLALLLLESLGRHACITTIDGGTSDELAHHDRAGGNAHLDPVAAGQ
jgi:hypothetical protein